MNQIKKVPIFDSDIGFPRWFHPHGNKLSVSKDETTDKTLVLKSKAVKVKIGKSDTQDGYILTYTIVHSRETAVSARIWMSAADIETAFSISDTCDELWGQNVLDRFGGDVAYQGKYIRYGRFLNIPCPGSGTSGDPNISIYTDDDIKAAIELFLKQ